MKQIYPAIFLWISFFALSIQPLFAQEQLPNPNFEDWENVGTNEEEPLDWSSNKTGGGIANTGPQTCFREDNDVYDGNYSLRVRTRSFFTVEVNGTATTGRIEAPNTNPANGYLRTIRNNPDFNAPFSSRPDSLVGYYKYDSDNSDQGKIEIYLHGDYDVENPDQGGSAPFMIAIATFLTPTSDVNNWTRFSVPFVYTSPDTPLYILAAVASSADAGTAQGGSTLWADNFELIYVPCTTSDTLVEATCAAYTSPSGRFVFSQSGMYADTLMNAEGCDSLLTIDLTIDTVEVGVSQTGNTLTAMAADASYQWIDCDNANAPIGGATQATYTPTENGNYAVIVNQGACSDTSACQAITTVSLEPTALQQTLTWYPNPATEQLFVELGTLYQSVSISLTDLNGRELWTQNVTQTDRLAIPVHSFGPGMYLLRLTANGESAYLKWMRSAE